MSARANIIALNADPDFRARVEAAAAEGMRRWWESRKLPPLTPRQRWTRRKLILNGVAPALALALSLQDRSAARVDAPILSAHQGHAGDEFL